MSAATARGAEGGTLPFAVWDVFTDRPFAGNPLSIVEAAGDLATAQMQTIARQFNLSKTIFLMPPRDPAHTARASIFVPTAENPSPATRPSGWPCSWSAGAGRPSSCRRVRPTPSA